MRIIDQLRKLYPGKWRYDSEFSQYVHESGRSVFRCAALSPRYDGDDDSFETQLRWSDTGERIYLYGGLK
jgi:hypothetical protein